MVDTTTKQRWQSERVVQTGSRFPERRAARLRAQAASMHPLVASAYYRRAAELELLAGVASGRSGRDGMASAGGSTAA